MKITVYTITDCQFSKQEKEYLQSHNLAFEEKNLELNKEWLTEMMAVSNNFAGTPVTRVEKDDGTIRVFKGFTKEEFDEFFGFANQTNTPQPQSPQTNPASQNPQPQDDSKLNDVLNKLEEKTEEENNQNQPIQSYLTNQNEPTTQQTNPLNNFNQDFSSAPTPNLENIPQENKTDKFSQTPEETPPQNLPQIPDLPNDLKS